MNHSSYEDIGLRDGRGAPDVEQLEKQHYNPYVFQDHVDALVFTAISVELSHVDHCQHYQDEQIEDEGECLGSACKDVQGSHDQKREEG